MIRPRREVRGREDVKSGLPRRAPGWRPLTARTIRRPVHHGNAGFKVGVLLVGLEWYPLRILLIVSPLKHFKHD